MQEFWTYSIDGSDYYDAEFILLAECLKHMDEKYAEQLEGEEFKNGDTRSCPAEIIRFRYNEDGEKEIIFRQKATAEYEHYHGDLAEHGTW